MAGFGKAGTRVDAGRASFGKKPSPRQGQLIGKSAPQPSARAQDFLEQERRRSSMLSAPGSDLAAPRMAGNLVPLPITCGKPVFGRRIIAAIIDFIIVLTAAVILLVGFNALTSSPADQFALSWGFAVALLLVLVGAYAYQIVWEAGPKQATLGKQIVGAVVVSTDGSRPTLQQVILRNTIGRLCSNLVPFYIGYFIGLFREDRRCLHDLIAGTMVCERTPHVSAVPGGELIL